MNNGYIYVIKLDVPFKRHIPYKIGFTKNPDERMSALSTSLPYEMDICILEQIENAKEFEQLLHDHFHKQKIRGERFSLCNTDVSVINMLLDEFKKGNLLSLKYIHEAKGQAKKVNDKLVMKKCLNCRKDIKSYVSAQRPRKFCNKFCLQSYRSPGIKHHR